MENNSNSRYATGDGRYVTSNDPAWLAQMIKQHSEGPKPDSQYLQALKNRLEDVLYDKVCPRCGGTGRLPMEAK